MVDLLGSGQATLRFAESGAFPGTFNVTAVRYEFDSAAPVPEPTSLAMAAMIGVLPVIRRRFGRG